MFTETVDILLILTTLIAGCVWLERYKVIHFIGSGFLVLLLTAAAVNIGIIPPVAGGAPIYTFFFHDVAPLSIFYVLLSVRLTALRHAGKSMLILFLVGSTATITGVLVAMQMPGAAIHLGDQPHALAGMYAATYIGGGLNFNAVALHYGISEKGTLFAAATVADNILSAVWVMATLLLPRFLQKWMPMQKEEFKHRENATEEPAHASGSYTLSLSHFFMLLALGIGCMTLSHYLHTLLPAIPSVIWLTTLALVLAQIPYIHTMQGHLFLGMAGIYFLLAAIGASCDLQALWVQKDMTLFLLAFVVCIALVHGLILFGVGFLLRKDWDYTSIASQANIGGTVTAMALAKSLGRQDLVLPAILAGTLGNAIGTYAGIALASILAA